MKKEKILWRNCVKTWANCVLKIFGQLRNIDRKTTVLESLFNKVAGRTHGDPTDPFSQATEICVIIELMLQCKTIYQIKHRCLSQTGQSTTWWWKKAAMAKFQSVREAFQWWTTFTRPGGKGGWGCCIRPIFLLNPVFDELKKNSVTVKIVQNYKTAPLTFTCSKSTIQKDVKYVHS